MRQCRPTIGVRGGRGRAIQPGTSGPIGWPYAFKRSGTVEVCPMMSEEGSGLAQWQPTRAPQPAGSDGEQGKPDEQEQ
jgi:hypothetical protein